MDFLIRIPFLFLITGITGFFYFESNYQKLKQVEYTKLQESTPDETFITSIGTDKNYANMVAIQPYMIPADYSSETRFYEKLESYIIKAKRSGFLKERTTIIFPDHIGTPLYLIDERREVYTSKTIDDMFSNLNSTKYPNLKRTNFTTKTDLTKYLLDEKSNLVKDTYISTFSKLALFYKVNILAGSIVLPISSLSNGELNFIEKDRKVYGFMFDNKGKITQKVERKFLYSFETDFLIPGKPPEEGLVVPGIPNKMAVLFSGDTLLPISYTRIIQVTDLWVSPVFKLSTENMDYSKIEISGEIQNPTKSNYKESDSLLTNRELWNKFSTPGRHASTSSKSYLQVFLNGEFYDFKLDSWTCGNSKSSGKQEFIEPRRTSAILNLNL
jgi:hypothetical protein